MAESSVYLENDDEFFSAESDTEDTIQNEDDILKSDDTGGERASDDGKPIASCSDVDHGHDENETTSGVCQDEEVDKTEGDREEEEDLTEEEIEV